ncbi:MAG: hypothetical protein ACTHK6_05225 [Solirubrobacterales bacterium]
MQQLLYFLSLLARDLTLKCSFRYCACLGLPRLQRSHVLFVSRVRERSLQLDQQRLGAHPQLQRRLAVAAGVEVGTRPQQQGLAGVEPLAAAEDGGDPFLGAQLFLAPSPSGPPPRPDIDLACFGEAAVGGLLAAAVADQDPLRPGGGELGAAAGIGRGDRLRVQRSVQQRDRFLGEDVDGVLGLAGLVQPAPRFLLAGEGGEGPDRGGAGEDQRRRLGIGRAAAPTPAPLRPQGRAQPPQDEDALLLTLPRARQVAAVRQGKRTGEVELDESE